MTATDSDPSADPAAPVAPIVSTGPDAVTPDAVTPDAVAPVVRRRRAEQGRTGRGARAASPTDSVDLTDRSDHFDQTGAPVRRSGGSRPGGRSGRGRHTVWWQLATTMAFVLLIVGLAFAGYRASRLITGGSAEKVTDPKAPNFVAEVRPTPVDLVAITAPDDSLAGVLIVSGAAKGGTVSALPATMSPGPGEDGLMATIGDAFRDGGLDQLRSVLGTGLTFGFTSAEQVSSADLTAVAGLVGPVTVKNVDNLIDSPDRGKIGMDRAKETVKYRAGEVVLEPGDVAGFLGFSGIGESPDRQMLRHLAVWDQVLSGLKGKDLSQLGAGGGANNGLSAVGELLTELEGATSPTRRCHSWRSRSRAPPSPRWCPIRRHSPHVARVVPFPTSATPGQRARVELLNGTTKDGAALLAAPKVVAAGGEISLLGNASSFDVATTTVQYMAPEAKDAADAIAKALGVSATPATSESGGIDVRVTIGGDRTA